MHANAKDFACIFSFPSFFPSTKPESRFLQRILPYIDIPEYFYDTYGQKDPQYQLLFPKYCDSGMRGGISIYAKI